MPKFIAIPGKHQGLLPEEVEAHRWWSNGDHPDDLPELIRVGDGPLFMTEGKRVRRFRRPGFPGTDHCRQCRNYYHLHGWLDIGGNGIVVCPGDMVLTVVVGDLALGDHGVQHTAIDFDAFAAIYAPAPGTEPLSRDP